MNPEKEYPFYKQFCNKHPKNTLDFICQNQSCSYYLNLQCKECRQIGLQGDHSHKCTNIEVYVKKQYQNIIKSLTEPIKEILRDFTQNINQEIKAIENELPKWFSPLQQSTTQKDFIYTVQNPSKWEKIQATATLKGQIIERQLKMISNKFSKEVQKMTSLLHGDMYELRYRLYDQKWKFDKQFTHPLANVSGLGDRTADKKSQLLKFCVSVTNQPITPYNNDISFIINSQHPYDKGIVLGLCHRKTILDMNFESNLQRGIYGIYQARKAGGTNNAYSLHYSDDIMQYKEMVGWNFISGDTVSISLKTSNDRRAKVVFKKKGHKETFEMFMHLSEVFLYPFVALYAQGDKITIDNK